MGVQTSDGDGTVPLISLGLMCHKGWRSRALNPAGMRVVTREFRHQPVSVYRDVRGGPHTADHVDILGNAALLADVLHIAAGETGELGDQVHSDIARIAANVPLWRR
jgi:phospholipid:diacylglycerol acyltransferase